MTSPTSPQMNPTASSPAVDQSPPDEEVLAKQATLTASLTAADRAAFLERMHRHCGEAWFRWADQPVLFPPRLTRDLLGASEMVIAHIVQQRRATPPDLSTVPEDWRSPVDDVPHIILADFAVQPDHSVRLVEVQSVPAHFIQNLHHGESWVAVAMSVLGRTEATRLNWTITGMDSTAYLEFIRACITGGHAPDVCAMVDVRLAHQHILTEFRATQRTLGIPIVDAHTITQDADGRLYRPDGAGGRSPIRRIYNRMLFDEVRLGPPLPFSLRRAREAGVEIWPPPADQFLVNKGMMTGMTMPSVPKTTPLDRVPAEILSGDLTGYVLKRVEGFGGNAVHLDVTPDVVQRIPATERSHWILQQRLTYGMWVPVPTGYTTPSDDDQRLTNVGTEVRCILARRAGDHTLTPLSFWVRTSRGPLFNAGSNRTSHGAGFTMGLFVERTA